MTYTWLLLISSLEKGSFGTRQKGGGSWEKLGRTGDWELGLARGWVCGAAEFRGTSGEGDLRQLRAEDRRRSGRPKSYDYSSPETGEGEAARTGPVCPVNEADEENLTGLSGPPGAKSTRAPKLSLLLCANAPSWLYRTFRISPVIID